MYLSVDFFITLDHQSYSAQKQNSLGTLRQVSRHEGVLLTGLFHVLCSVFQNSGSPEQGWYQPQCTGLSHVNHEENALQACFRSCEGISSTEMTQACVQHTQN